MNGDLRKCDICHEIKPIEDFSLAYPRRCKHCVSIQEKQKRIAKKKEEERMNLEKNRLYISIPISGHDIEEVKKRANEIKESFIPYYDEVLTPFDVCNEKDKPYQYYMGRDVEALLCCKEVFMSAG